MYTLSAAEAAEDNKARIINVAKTDSVIFHIYFLLFFSLFPSCFSHYMIRDTP
ncbi:hypothetical protein MmTuc01_2940 [Methanosarcina mazei Tuc01]|uniref:Uncharacterized protein n=1 Tax=Methanosarcina mazei Tuc01 TaxID=1236903 RepID=M1PCF5_METMZ|nr:hypothetical protein MmTuc01_2940 [Methanosarcina mazei Tuc01]